VTVLGADAASDAAGACGHVVFAPSQCSFNATGSMFVCQ
jgi:hypothetical protein